MYVYLFYAHISIGMIELELKKRPLVINVCDHTFRMQELEPKYLTT